MSTESAHLSTFGAETETEDEIQSTYNNNNNNNKSAFQPSSLWRLESKDAQNGTSSWMKRPQKTISCGKFSSFLSSIVR